MCTGGFQVNGSYMLWHTVWKASGSFSHTLVLDICCLWNDFSDFKI